LFHILFAQFIQVEVCNLMTASLSCSGRDLKAI
jgi:hypothetical protein